MLKKEWPSDRERLEWHKRLISNPFGSKMVPHCITTSAFTADNFGHRVQSIYLRIRQLKSTKHHTKNNQPKSVKKILILFKKSIYRTNSSHAFVDFNLVIWSAGRYRRQASLISRRHHLQWFSIPWEFFKSWKLWFQRLMGFMSLAPIQCTFSIHITCLSLPLASECYTVNSSALCNDILFDYTVDLLT